VDIDTEEEPIELLEDHLDTFEGSEENAVGGDGANPDAAGGDDAKDGGDDDPDDDPEPADAVDEPPLEPHYKKQIHHLDFAEGPFPALL
jgi:hypothetical protein